MSERTLHGYEQSLVDLADASKMTDQQLQASVQDLEAMQTRAQELHLDRQVKESTRLLGHYGFERAMREGVSPALYRDLVGQTAVEESEVVADVELVSADA